MVDRNSSIMVLFIISYIDCYPFLYETFKFYLFIVKVIYI
jgi:hypothetical protein